MDKYKVVCSFDRGERVYVFDAINYATARDRARIEYGEALDEGRVIDYIWVTKNDETCFVQYQEVDERFFGRSQYNVYEDMKKNSLEYKELAKTEQSLVEELELTYEKMKKNTKEFDELVKEMKSNRKQ